MVRAYTRRDYIRKTPNSRIVQYDMGNLTDEFPISVSLAVKKPAQIRHNSLEAARIASNRLMQRKAGRLGYHLKLRTYPHQIVRENPMATGAGADRVQSGMRNAFGKPISVEAAELLECFLEDDYKLEDVKGELADVLMVALTLAMDLNLDVKQLIETKLLEVDRKYADK